MARDEVTNCNEMLQSGRCQLKLILHKFAYTNEKLKDFILIGKYY